jgi:hypothetical protein
MRIGHIPAIGWAGLAALLAFLAGLEQAAGGTPAFRDNLYYFLPQFEACRLALANGELPLWNPFMGCGHPLMATLQCAVASPLTLPFLVFPYVFAVKVFCILALLTASGGMFALARRAGLTPAGACLAAVLYPLAGPMRSLTEWPPIIAGIALLPALLVAFDRLLRAERGGIVCTALLASLQVFAGQPRQSAIAGLACLLWALSFRPGPGEFRGASIRSAGALALALLFSSVQLLPSLELFLQSERHLHGIPASTVRESFMHFGDLITLVLARSWGDENGAFGPGRLLVPRLYVGWIGAWLAVSGAIHCRGRAHYFSILAVITGFVIALGGPVYRTLFASGPEAHSLRYLGHMVIPSFVGLALLAGGGLDRLSAPARGRTGPLVLAPALLLAGILASPATSILHGLTGWPVISAPILASLRMNSAVGALLLAAAWGIRNARPGRPAMRAAFPILLAADLVAAFYGYNFRVDRDFFRAPPVLAVEGIRDGRVFIPSSGEQIYTDNSPVTMRERYRSRLDILSPNIPQLFGVRNAHGYEPFRLESQRLLFGGWEDETGTAGAALRATGVRWAVLPAHLAEPGWIKRLAIAGEWSLWEVPGPRRLAEVVPAAAVKSGWRDLNSAPLTGSARVGGRGWNSLEGAVTAQTDSVLLIRNSWYPGWKAYLNGRRAPVIRAGGVFMAIPVPEGRSQVWLTYCPASFRLGLFLSCIGLAFALLAGLNSLFSARHTA